VSQPISPTQQHEMASHQATPKSPRKPRRTGRVKFPDEVQFASNPNYYGNDSSDQPARVEQMTISNPDQNQDGHMRRASHGSDCGCC
jgi:hypothetical protein